ncbi:MAG: hypothetical protein J3R72DRAFT_489223 [Linnemannia gamsii]|nr:MAG: hypothetical protein J3R72DRAFT_489223 [Linnemannia gamsii]
MISSPLAICNKPYFSSCPVETSTAQEHKKVNRNQESSDCTQPPQSPRLQGYCPPGVYISMAMAYPAEVVKFQVVRPDPEPEPEGLERVSINIDDNNFPQIFPERHVKFLDKLKQT